MEQIIATIRAGFERIISLLLGRKLGDNRNRRFQVINITVPANTVAGTLIEVDIALDREFNKIVGLGFFQKLDGGIPGEYSVGARSNRKTWVDDITVNAWNANDNVAPMQKYYESDIPYGSGDTWYARVTPDSAPATDLTGQMVLILEKTLTELPK